MKANATDKQLWKLYSENDFEAILQETDNPDSAAKLAYRGYALIQLGKEENGLALLEEAFESNPKAFAPNFLFGRYFQNLQRPRRAYAYMTRAADANRGHCNIDWETEIFGLNQWLDMVYLPKIQGFPEVEHSRAAQIYEEALEAIDEDRLEVALNKLQKALQKDPEAITIWVDLGHILNNLNRLEESLEAYMKSLDLDPEKAVSHYNVGTVHYKLGHIERALEYLRHSLELDADDPDTLYNIGLCYWEKGEPDLAEGYFAETLFLVPLYLNAQFYLAKLEARKGETDSATQRVGLMLEEMPEWRSAFEKDPDLGSLKMDE